MAYSEYWNPKNETLPREQLQASGLLARIAADGTLPIPASVRAPSGAAGEIRERAAFTDEPPASSKLPVSYQRVPGWARALVASAIGRLQRRRVARWATFPGFPLDVSADVAADLERGDRADALRPTPVLVSHDIDSPEGLRNLVDRFLPLEEAVGARSINFIVPCAWPIDDGLVA